MGVQLSDGTLRLYTSSHARDDASANELPGFVALYDREARARLTYSHRGDELEVVTLHAATPGLGLASQLILAARKLACDLRCRRMWLITTNDN